MATNALTHDYVWEDYERPDNIADIALPGDVKARFLSYVKDGQIPNLLLTSTSPGTGKTTSALALAKSIGSEYLFINASMENSIDDVRTRVVHYANTASLMGGAKVVILDECDRLSPAAQDALKGVIEQNSKRCRFIATANTKSRLTEPLMSRLTEVEFTFTDSDKLDVRKQVFERCCQILERRGVEYDKRVLVQMVARYSPDNRKLIQSLQRAFQTYGKIDEGALSTVGLADVNSLVDNMRTTDYGAVKSWAFDNYERLGSEFYRMVYSALVGRPGMAKSEDCLIEPLSVPELVLILGKYQMADSVVPDRFIHYLAMLTDVMIAIKWKK